MSYFGLLIVDKPIGPTSHQVVSVVRRGTGIRKVGHAGTLDPRASGVLILCLGPATRLSEYLSTASKRYQAVIRFGSATETYDTEGEILHQTGKAPSRKEIEEVLPEFMGEINQVPPPYSAIKVSGSKAYELAREGKEIELDPRQVIIYDLKFISYKAPDLALEIECSAGTYIRSLAYDLGERVSTGAHLAALRRVKSGPFTIDDAIPFPKLEVGFLVDKWDRYIVPAVDALPDLPIVKVTQEDLDHVKHGHRISAKPGSSGLARAISYDGELVAILEAVENGTLWHPRKVFIG
ncbi:MAG: tRNA pseudouridine(55) synthase TruB [Chloroflexi bacterium RBG_16_48_8]|nr:MAG: tRNA pseudouridine(55) synthase TruB [Chloroflexi bacterium RBG_16_48_8]